MKAHDATADETAPAADVAVRAENVTKRYGTFTALDRVIERLALGEVVRKPAGSLSRGYRQRTALAQALIHEPDVLILDEPTNGLDPRQIIEMRSLIQSLAGKHTVLMSSHILGEVAKTAERVAILLNGRLLGVRAVADTPDLEDWFLSLT